MAQHTTQWKVSTLGGLIALHCARIQDCIEDGGYTSYAVQLSAIGGLRAAIFTAMRGGSTYVHQYILQDWLSTDKAPIECALNSPGWAARIVIPKAVADTQGMPLLTTQLLTGLKRSILESWITRCILGNTISVSTPPAPSDMVVNLDIVPVTNGLIAAADTTYVAWGRDGTVPKIIEADFGTGQLTAPPQTILDTSSLSQAIRDLTATDLSMEINRGTQQFRVRAGSVIENG